MIASVIQLIYQYGVNDSSVDLSDSDICLLVAGILFAIAAIGYEVTIRIFTRRQIHHHRHHHHHSAHVNQYSVLETAPLKQPPPPVYATPGYSQPQQTPPAYQQPPQHAPPPAYQNDFQKPPPAYNQTSYQGN